MAKNLLKITGIVLLSTIPKNISEYGISYLNKINPPKEIEINERIIVTKEDLIQYNQKIQEIDDELKLLNVKKDFLLKRLNEPNTFSKRKEFYLKELTETEQRLNEQENQKNSIYDSIKKDKIKSNNYIIE